MRGTCPVSSLCWHKGLRLSDIPSGKSFSTVCLAVSLCSLLLRQAGLAKFPLKSHVLNRTAGASYRKQLPARLWPNCLVHCPLGVWTAGAPIVLGFAGTGDPCGLWV